MSRRRLSLQEVEAAWIRLEASYEAPDRSVATCSSPWSFRGDTILLGRDGQSRRHLLIPIGDRDKITPDKDSAGVHLLDRSLLDGGKLRRFLDVVCRKPHLEDLFSIIVADIVESLEAPGRADQAVRGVLERWRELLETERIAAPSLEKLVGVFAELHVLRELAEHSSRVGDAWLGPDGERHDIVTPAGSVEVKGTRSRVGRQVEIHGVEQLEPPQSGELFLVYVRVERDSNGRSVLDLVDDLEGAGCSAARLRSALIKLGITADHADDVRAVRLTVRERVTYVVADDFPRIIRSSFPAERLPDGVIALNYRIDLSSEPPAPLPEAEWVWHAASLAASVS